MSKSESAHGFARINDHLSAAEIEGEIIVVSDGSTDETVNIAHELGSVKVLDLPEQRGKSSALNEGVAVAKGDVVILCDVRQTWEEGAVDRLLANFADPKIGAVSGELVLKKGDGALAGVGLYWHLEKWMRRHESLLHCCVGVTGAFCAVRRRLFHHIPDGTILDDVYWPMQVVMAGYRVVHDERARTFDYLPALQRDEFRRKVRTLAGNYQLLVRLPAVLSPWRNAIFIQFLSHKLFRLFVPWAMLVMVISSLMLPGPFFRTLFVVQCVCYAFACLGLVSKSVASRLPLASTAAAFLLLNSACGLALFVWLTGWTDRIWRPVAYESDRST